MTKLEELVKELCPDGVDFCELEEVCHITKGVQFNKADMSKQGSYPVINGGINPSGYIEQYNQRENTITISQGGASAGFVNWLSTKFWAGAHCYVLIPKEIIQNRYLYHFVKSKECKLQECQYGAGIPALAKSTIAQTLIPVPPLPVQEEIVRILDSFTELTAELTARKKQYEYYRERWLTTISNEQIAMCNLGDICDVSAGSDAPKDDMSIEKTETHCVPIISNGIGENAIYGYTSSPKITVPAVTVAARGTIGYAEYRDYPYYPIIRLLSVIPKDSNVLYTKYLYYTTMTKSIGL